MSVYRQMAEREAYLTPVEELRRDFEMTRLEIQRGRRHFEMMEIRDVLMGLVGAVFLGLAFAAHMIWALR